MSQKKQQSNRSDLTSRGTPCYAGECDVCGIREHRFHYSLPFSLNVWQTIKRESGSARFSSHEGCLILTNDSITISKGRLIFFIVYCQWWVNIMRIYCETFRDTRITLPSLISIQWNSRSLIPLKLLIKILTDIIVIIPIKISYMFPFLYYFLGYIISRSNFTVSFYKTRKKRNYFIRNIIFEIGILKTLYTI